MSLLQSFVLRTLLDFFVPEAAEAEAAHSDDATSPMFSIEFKAFSPLDDSNVSPMQPFFVLIRKESAPPPQQQQQQGPRRQRRRRNHIFISPLHAAQRINLTENSESLSDEELKLKIIEAIVESQK